MSDFKPEYEPWLYNLPNNRTEGEARAEERERCACVVENMGRSNGRIRPLHKRIAAEIRSGNERIGTLRTETVRAGKDR